MRIVIVRHGEPDYEHDCLTERGRIQAAAAASEALRLPVKTLDFMRELRWGSVDGTPVPADGHPWDIADLLAAEGWDLTDPAWREHPYFRSNRVTAEADYVAEKTDEWLYSLGYERNGAYYRCIRPGDRQETVALFCHGGSSSAMMGRILNLTFPYACGLFHLEFTGITVIRLDRNPGRQVLPCLELANDGRHLRGLRYHRLADM